MVSLSIGTKGRTDGSNCAFSYIQALKTPDPEGRHLRDFRDAMRQEVKDQTQAIKTKMVGQPCPVLGVPMSREVIDIDHVTPFATLLRNFLAEVGWDPATVEVTSTSDDVRWLTDRAKGQQWQDWHRDHAVLRAMHRDAHRTKDGKKAKPLDETMMAGSARRKATRVFEDPASEDLDALIASIR